VSTRVGFYHLTRSPLDKALPKLLERARSAGHKVLIVAGSAERVAFLDTMLWTYDPASWLAHGTAKDGDAALQPIFLTDKDENPNGADMLVLIDGVGATKIDTFTRCALVFDGNDGEAVDAARAHWAEWKDQGFQLAYHQQTEQGGWEEKATANAAGG
jgi:DNA polymerase-3 subunit chi